MNENYLMGLVQFLLVKGGTRREGNMIHFAVAQENKTYRLTYCVTDITLLFNYWISIRVKGTLSLFAYIIRCPSFVNFFKHRLPAHCGDTIV
jgi:hypothetical protein